MQLTTYVSGRLTATVTGPRGTRKFSGPNLVTDMGLNGAVGLDTTPNLGAIGSILRLAVGVGNAAPSPQDTTLDDLARSSACDSRAYPPSLTHREGWAVQRFRETCTFDPDGVARNYTEVGLYSTSQTSGANARMAQRALFRDELGTPTIVTVGVDEYLTVEWDTYLWRSISDRVFEIEIDGTPTAVTVRPVASTANHGRSVSWGSSTLFANTRGAGYPAGTDLVDHTATLGNGATFTNTTTYTPLGTGHVRVDCTVPPTALNLLGGIGVLVLGRTAGSATAAGILWRSQMKFDPPIPKDVTKEMTLSIILRAEAGEPPED